MSFKIFFLARAAEERDAEGFAKISRPHVLGGTSQQTNSPLTFQIIRVSVQTSIMNGLSGASSLV